MSERVTIPVTAQCLSQCREGLMNVVQSKFGIRTIFHPMENGDPFQSSRTAQAKGVKRYSVHLSGGPEISVWKDDLTTHHVDAVVNAANENLKHGAGLAGALSRVGGPEVQKWSDAIINFGGKILTGQAVVTQAGHLPCKAIIHAVGPALWVNPTNKQVDEASHLLNLAVKSILILAEKEHFQSVAIPALSSGLFNFPLRDCANIIVKTLKDYKFGQDSQLLDIRLVNHDELTVSEMERACKEILQVKSHSIAVKAPGTRSATPSLQMGNITMHIKKGQIEQEKVDVIVNTISKNLDLSQGLISKAILKRAGDNIQKEIKLYSPRDYGDVIETKSHNLHCSCVYHTVCADKWTTSAPEILRQAVLKCLDKAKDKYSSISFPAIGTGSLRFDRVEVAKIMIKAVADFAGQNKGKKMDVYFVLYPTDAETLTAFQQELCQEDRQSMKSSAFNTRSYPDRSGYDGDGATNEAQACIELTGGSLVCQVEAKRWINEAILMASNKFTIFNNHVLHFGQREHEELLSLQSACEVSIREVLLNGVARVTIEGPQWGVRRAVLRVEALCCQAQEEFALAEESAMMHAAVRWSCAEIPALEKPENSIALERAFLAGQNTQNVTVNGMEIQVSIIKMEAKDPSGKGCRVHRQCMTFQNRSFYQRTTMTHDQRNQVAQIKGFDIINIEKVENTLLEHRFQLKQRQMSSSPKLLYQQVPAQFCDLVCRVGFQRQYSLPKEQKLGAGIYFGGSAHTAKELAEHFGNEEYIYIFEAKVLTGKHTRGSPGLIIPPAIGSDPLYLYDSVKGGVDTHVIFNSQQALPVYLFTYKPAKHSH